MLQAEASHKRHPCVPLCTTLLCWVHTLSSPCPPLSSPLLTTASGLELLRLLCTAVDSRVAFCLHPRGYCAPLPSCHLPSASTVHRAHEAPAFVSTTRWASHLAIRRDEVDFCRLLVAPAMAQLRPGVRIETSCRRVYVDVDDLAASRDDGLCLQYRRCRRTGRAKRSSAHARPAFAL